MLKYLIDTDVLIDYLRGLPQATEFLDDAIVDAACYISAMTVAELYAGVKEGKETQTLGNFLQAFELVEISPTVAQQGGTYRRNYGKSHGVGLADAVIAATAEYCSAKLVTLNKKHFPMLKQIVTPYIKKVGT